MSLTCLSQNHKKRSFDRIADQRNTVATKSRKRCVSTVSTGNDVAQQRSSPTRKRSFDDDNDSMKNAKSPTREPKLAREAACMAKDELRRHCRHHGELPLTLAELRMFIESANLHVNETEVNAMTAFEYCCHVQAFQLQQTVHGMLVSSHMDERVLRRHSENVVACELGNETWRIDNDTFLQVMSMLLQTIVDNPFMGVEFDHLIHALPNACVLRTNVDVNEIVAYLQRMGVVTILENDEAQPLRWSETLLTGE